MGHPPVSRFFSPAAGRAVLLLTLVAGAAVRIAVYLQNRSLFLDEANLARNVAERDLAGFFSRLDYEQFAPPLFLVWTKFHTLLLGNTEYALRLLPLLAGLASLYLFYRLSGMMITFFPVRWMAVWIVAFQEQLLRYATECKQYGTDVFAALLLLFLAMRRADRPLGWRQAVAWGLFGMVLISFSMPVAFVLAGVGMYQAVQFWRKSGLRSLGPLTLSIGMWLAGFGGLFFGLLRSDAESAYLQQYHAPYFLPFPPIDWADWRQAGQLLLQLVKSFSGATSVAVVSGITGLVAAWAVWLRRRSVSGLLWTLPVLTCLAASAGHYYSLIGRLVLFLMPILLLMSSLGWDAVWRKAHTWLKPLVALALVSMASLHFTLPYLWSPYQIEEIRPALAFVEDQIEPGEGLYLGQWAIPAFSFYQKHAPAPLDLPAPTPADNLPDTRLWLVYTHLVASKEWESMEADLARFREEGKLEEAFRSTATVVWRWMPNGSLE